MSDDVQTPPHGPRCGPCRPRDLSWQVLPWPSVSSASTFLCPQDPSLPLRAHASITWLPLWKGHLLRETIPDCNISRDTYSPLPLLFCLCPFSLSQMIFTCVFPGHL